jgi:hypothetical protein
LNKHQLAQELRQRHYTLGHVERKYIDVLSDDDIIASYLTCSGCGKTADEVQAEAAIHLATSADHFLKLTEGWARHSHG